MTTAPRRSTGDMQEYLDRMKTVLAEIEAEQASMIRSTPTSARGQAPSPTRLPPSPQPLPRSPGPPKSSPQPPHLSPSLLGNANLSASLSTLTSDLEALSGHWASTPRGDRGPKAQRLSHYQVWVKSPDTLRARRRTFPGSLGESTPRHLLEEADPARAGHASEADGRDGLPGGSGSTPCKAAPASIQEAAGMPAATATSGLQGTGLLVEAVALSTITETELTGETRLPQTGTGVHEVETTSAWEAAGSPDVGTAILDDLGGHHDQEPGPVDQQAAASREESPSASASTAPEAAFTDADTASSGEESAPGSPAAGIAVLQELSRDPVAGAPGPAVEPEPGAELPSGCPTPVDRIDLISPPVCLSCLPQPGPTSTPVEAGPGQTGSPNQHNPNVTAAGSTERDGVLSESSSGGSSGADGAEDVGPRPSPPCSQQPPLQAPPQQRLQALSRLKQRAAARHTSVLSSAQRSRSASPEVGPPPGDAAAHAPGSAALPHRATRLAPSPVLLTDAGTQVLDTPAASSPTVAAKPFLKRRTSAVQSQRLDWSGVGPRTTTKLDPNLILDRTPGSSRSNSSAGTPTARALQGGGRRGGVLEKGPTSLAGPCEAPASPTGEALHALLPPGRRASGAGLRRPRAPRAGLPAADLWVAGGAVAEAGPAAAENPLGDLLQQMDGLLSDVQRHIRG
ncbi:hypothetical protein ACKKBG_A09290 [Auxenochlorella protothecoides x Auxenochlorella symbiontica]